MYTIADFSYLISISIAMSTQYLHIDPHENTRPLYDFFMIAGPAEPPNTPCFPSGWPANFLRMELPSGLVRGGGQC